MQHTLTSTPVTRALRRLARGERVRIMFYGQSITKQAWWQAVVAGLRAAFPRAEIEAVNPAVGGFSSQKLVDTVHQDVCAWYPDLLIFHVFGDHYRYEDIIRCVRAHTTAEVAIQSDHFAAGQDPTQPDDGWTTFWNTRLLPAIAEAYGCALLPIREGWRQHLLAKGEPPTAYLRDGAHMNDAGNALMAELVLRELLAYPADGPAAIDDDITTHDVHFVDGRCRLAFTGNRVVALAAGASSPVKVLIDGHPPSAHPGCYTFTRANVGPGVDWPWTVCVPYGLTWQTPPVAETWTLTLTAGDARALAFRLEGSVTGPDGEGRFTFPETEKGPYDPPFVSHSGRVVIDPRRWWRQTDKKLPNPLVPGYAIRFDAALLGTDRYLPDGPGDVVLAQGLANGSHTLELLAEDPATAMLPAVRIHRPPLDTAMARITDGMEP